MIHFILCQNKNGNTRLAKYYTQFSSEERNQLEKEINKIVSTRSSKLSNFLLFHEYQLVYRRYASLYFTIVCDIQDNPLSMLEAIHLYVETLNTAFGTVCELNLIFDFTKCYIILDNIISAGMIQETSQQSILQNVATVDVLE